MDNGRIRRLVVVGSMNMDLSVQVLEIPKSGETILGSKIKQRPGGKGSNQAVAAAKLGTNVSLISMVGNDSFGAELINNTKNHGIETNYILSHPQESTGIALITVSDSGENAIVVAPGANSELTPGLAESSLLKIGDFGVLSSCLEIPLETVKKAFEIANKNGALTVLNASPFTKECLTIIPLTDFLIVNEHELIEMCGFGIEHLEDLRETLSTLKVRHIIVTLGSAGALYVDVTKVKLTTFQLPAPTVKAIDTTGCGDAFAGALAGEIASGASIQEALELAIKAGSYAATGFGAQSSYGTRSEIMKF